MIRINGFFRYDRGFSNFNSNVRPYEISGNLLIHFLWKKGLKLDNPLKTMVVYYYVDFCNVGFVIVLLQRESNMIKK